MIQRALVALAVVIVIVVAACAAFVASRQNLKFDAPYPPVEASTDSSVIARGRYVVRDVAFCTGCHGDPRQLDAILAGAEVPLSGGREWNIPPGKFYARNITPDPETGLGNVPPRAIARALRHGVGHDGRALLPFMEMQGLSDVDLVAVVSYLKTQPPVHNRVPFHQYNLLGMILRATVLANPVGPKGTPLAVSPRGATVENGRYLVESVALCGGCHTQRDEKTGAFAGPHLGGATGYVDPHLEGATAPADSVRRTWSPPNITSEPTTGRIARYSEDEFVARVHTGRVIPGSPMPWNSFQKMSDDDIRAIYRYLTTVPPVRRDVGPAVVYIGHADSTGRAPKGAR